MISDKRFNMPALILLLLVMMTGALAQDKTTGSIKGKVRVETGKPDNVSVTVRQGEREVTRVVTNNKGEFTINSLRPGVYGLTFRKAGMSVGTIENVGVVAGKVRSLNDRLVLTVDQGSIAFVRGSVFDAGGRSVSGARVEIALIGADGNLKKLDGRLTTETGQFAFRLPPDPAKYRITVKASGAETATKDVDVDDAVVYRIALTLQPAQK
jgi:hypothetical protein